MPLPQHIFHILFINSSLQIKCQREGHQNTKPRRAVPCSKYRVVVLVVEVETVVNINGIMGSGICSAFINGFMGITGSKKSVTGEHMEH
jgi:hypothetical protein